MLWVVEFKVRSKSVILWSEWFLLVLLKVHFCSNQIFSSLCSHDVREETNYFYHCTAEVFWNLTFLLIWFFGGQLNMNRGHSSLCSRCFGNLVVYLTDIVEILILFLPICSLKFSDRRSFYWFAEAIVWLLPTVAAPQWTNHPMLLFRSSMVYPDFCRCFLFVKESIVHPPSVVAAMYWSILSTLYD